MIVKSEIDNRITAFRTDLKTLDPVVILHKHLVYDSCFLFEDDLYCDLKETISNKWDVHPSEVIIVGSAKLGFTISPVKVPFRHFNDTSDIDVAIISSKRFEDTWKNVFKYEKIYGAWEEQELFRNYLYRGWMRPDKLPNSKSFPLKDEWFEYFRSLSSTGTYGPYKITCGLYHSWMFFDAYHLTSLINISSDISEDN